MSRNDAYKEDEKRIKRINRYLVAGGLATGIGGGVLIGRQFRKTGEAHEAAGRALEKNIEDLNKNWSESVDSLSKAGNDYISHVKNKGIIHALRGDGYQARKQAKRVTKAAARSKGRYNKLRNSGKSPAEIKKLIRRKIKWGFNDGSRPIEFDEAYKDGRQVFRQAHKVIKAGRFGGEVASDLDEAMRGERSNKRKKRFWEKKGVQNKALAALIAAGTVYAVRKRDKIKDGAQGIGARVKEYVENFDDGSSILALEDGTHVVEFAGDWYISKPTSKSVRVHNSEDGEPRKRRKKHFHETTKFKNRLIAATLAGAAVGVPAAALIGSRMGKNALYRDSKDAGYLLRPSKAYRKPGETKLYAQAEWHRERSALAEKRNQSTKRHDEFFKKYPEYYIPNN
jgi:hypothetical protein